MPRSLAESLEADEAVMSTSDPAVTAMSFEQALAELELIVQKLERGQLDLDSAIQAYERGTALRQHCNSKLREAELKVEKLSFDADGRAQVQPLDPA
jgi:exodeoxyribonuclease VII small subunit